MTTKRPSNYSIHLPDTTQDAIAEIQEITGISTKAGVIIEAIRYYLKSKS